MSVDTVYKLIGGLNSQTFNFLTRHADDLMITKNLKVIKIAAVTPVDFYSSCVSLNRPCSIPGMAKTWPAFKKWNYQDAEFSNLQNRLGNNNVQVYFDEDPNIDTDNFEGSSFNPEYQTTM